AKSKRSLLTGRPAKRRAHVCPNGDAAIITMITSATGAHDIAASRSQGNRNPVAIAGGVCFSEQAFPHCDERSWSFIMANLPFRPFMPARLVRLDRPPETISRLSRR